MAWTSKARQAALWKKAQHRASNHGGCNCVLRQVADRGGLGPAARILNDLGRPTIRMATERGHGRQFQWTGKQVESLTPRLGLRLDVWRVRAGRAGVRRDVKELRRLLAIAAMVPAPATAARRYLQLVSRGRHYPAESAAIQGRQTAAGEVVRAPEKESGERSPAWCSYRFR